MTETADSVGEKSIAALIDRFYGRVQADDRLGPIFAAAISDWDQHLEIMRDFWSAVLLRTGRYRGCVMSAHFRLSIASEDFERWLVLFRSSARETLPVDQAEHAITFAEALTHILREGRSSSSSIKRG